jgi:serine/threonine-protein kinase
MHDGQKVGPFQIEKEIGFGAMGQVFRARYIKTGQKVAIKVMAPGLRNATAQARFQREAEVLKQLNHPNIVRFYVVAEFEGAAYYAMEFVEGEPLDYLLERRGKLPWDDVVEIGKQVCAALQHAHDQGIIHRDLKPSNLMIMKDGTIKLTDFGIAKDLDVAQLTATNNTVGTAAYMSPEQCRGERSLTNKSDLYSLGVVLYELLVGAKPFEAETTMDLFLAHVQGTFERPSRRILDIPVWLDNLVCQLLEKKPEHRPYDAAMVSQALLQVAEKIQAQSSAGVDAAKARLADRNAARVTSDSKDRKAARTLLKSSEKKKRRKKRKLQVYEQGWFQAIGLAGMLAVVASLIYVAFRPPSHKQLFDQALKIMEKDDFGAWLEARKDGPIKQYLRNYGDSPPRGAEAEAAEVRQWADKIDVIQREKTLVNRKKAGFEPEDATEGLAREALDAESRAEFLRAKEKWQAVRKQKDSASADGQVLDMLADKHIRDIEKSDEILIPISNKLQLAKNDGKLFDSKDEPDRSAALALRYEAIGDLAQADATWQSILRANPDMETRSGNKPWIILATKKAKEMRKQLDTAQDETGKKTRLAALDARLADCATLLKERPVAAYYLCQDILELYANDKDPEVATRLGEFKKILASSGQASAN